MYEQDELEHLLKEHRQDGRWGPLARALTIVENSTNWAFTVPYEGSLTHTVGITGPPGAGKSTLIARLIEAYSAQGCRVAVLAVDPSSAVSGGAVLGDRLRMEKSLDGSKTVFVRSLATRGAHGALALAAYRAVALLAASGSFDLIVVETAGAGQTEVAIASIADTVVLVTVPGLGDAVQAVKAGLMEVADFVVVNMADRPGVSETVRHLRFGMKQPSNIVRTVATDGSGVAELVTGLERRWKNLTRSGEVAKLRDQRRRTEALNAAEAWLRLCWPLLQVPESATWREQVGTILREAANQWSD